jgi:hypothetical protein
MSTPTGIMHELHETGDQRIMWDRTNRDEVEAAMATFNSLTGKGYLAYEAKGKHGEQGKQIRRFDPDAERIILVKPLQGG